ncbi:hypothetical protein ACQQ2N_03030 [Dokdonella sp. MW10]|uniref:hypothetical protein n=1 Tax=Dokdonella sp. MW10 TaxID=2992926 RepID=UPI003F8064DD
MNPLDVIVAYVADVVGHLPRRERGDVALELQALLGEALERKAQEEARPADAAMAIALVRAFGEPAEVASRYGTVPTIIAPADARRFVRLTWIGLAVIWSLGLLASLQPPPGAPSDPLSLLATWWLRVVVPSLWWPGVLVAWFAAANLADRRRPRASTWKPRDARSGRVARGGLVLAMIGIVAGLAILAEPRLVLDLALGGRAAPEAYLALTWTDTFLQRQAFVLFLLVASSLPLFAHVLVQGHWTPRLRRVQDALALLTCAAMVWTVLDGPALATSAGDEAFKGGLVLIVIVTLAELAWRTWRMPRSAGGLRVRTS